MVQRGAVHQVRKLLKVFGEQAVRAQLQVYRHTPPRAYAPPASGRTFSHALVWREVQACRCECMLSTVARTPMSVRSCLAHVMRVTYTEMQMQ